MNITSCEDFKFTYRTTCHLFGRCNGDSGKLCKYKIGDDEFFEPLNDGGVHNELFYARINAEEDTRENFKEFLNRDE